MTMTIGDNVKKIRKEKKLTQQKLADEIGISRSYLGDIENNRNNPSEKTMYSLAEKLNVSMFYLTTGNKTVEDFSNNEISEAFRTLNINSENELKKELKQLIDSELSFAEVNYLINSLSFLKECNEEDLMTFAALIRTIRQTSPAYIENLKEDGSYNKEELKNFINETTDQFKKFLKKRSG